MIAILDYGATDHTILDHGATDHTVLAYAATDQSESFEYDGNQVSKSSRTGENTALKINTSEDHNSVEGKSQISKPCKSAKTKPSGKAYMQLCYSL